VARVCFTQNLQRHVNCPDEEIAGATVREVMDGYFARHPHAKSYVLDEQGGLRRHVVVFIGENRASSLEDAIPAGAEIWVMQALSGG
jgi:hypothetical protein